MNINDPSFLFLLLGKDHAWIPLLMLGMFLFQQWAMIKSCWKSWSPFRRPSMKWSVKIYTNKEHACVYGKIPGEIWAILMDMQGKLCKYPVSSVESIHIPHNSLLSSGVMSLPIGTIFPITDSIDVKCLVQYNDKSITSSDEDRNSRRTELEECTLDITLEANTLQEILTYIQNQTTHYKTEIQKVTEEKPHIVKPNISSNGHPNTLPFKSYKTFENMFFDEKEDLIHRLNMFRNRDVYQRLGLPHTLGLLFYGEPGTGKTSVIKAIANYMNMSLILVPMNLIKTRKQLEYVFHGEDMKYTVPYDKRIYVFEEIDCNGWEGLVKSREIDTQEKEQEQKKEKEKSSNQMITVVEDDMIKIVKKDQKDDDVLTLGAILEILDGITETPGRIVIMTTNHRSKLDSALTRPGRIDMEIEFKKLRAAHVAHIYEKWYGHAMSELDIARIPENQYTQADISQRLFKYERDPQGFVRSLELCLP